MVPVPLSLKRWYFHDWHTLHACLRATELRTTVHKRSSATLFWHSDHARLRTQWEFLLWSRFTLLGEENKHSDFPGLHIDESKKIQIIENFDIFLIPETKNSQTAHWGKHWEGQWAFWILAEQTSTFIPLFISAYDKNYLEGGFRREIWYFKFQIDSISEAHHCLNRLGVPLECGTFYDKICPIKTVK